MSFINSVQLVWFLPPGELPPLNGIYEGFVGRRPKASQTEEVQVPQTIVIESAQGDDGVFAYRFQSQPGRVDAFIGAMPTAKLKPGHPPAFEDIGPLQKRIEDGANKVPNFWGLADRVACVVQGYEIVSSPSAANRLICDITGVGKNIVGAEDVNITFNIKKTLPPPASVEVNRLFKWSPGTFQQLNIAMPHSPYMMSPTHSLTIPTAPVQTLNAVLVEVDVNTVAASASFDVLAQSYVMNELAREAIRSALAGREGF